MVVKGDKKGNIISTKGNKFITFYFILMSFEYITEYYWNTGITIMEYINRGMMIISFIFPIILMLIYKQKLTPYRIYFLMSFISGLYMTIMYQFIGQNKNLSYIGIYLGLLSAFFMSKINLEVLQKAFKLVAIGGIIVFLYIIFVRKIDIIVALRRGYVWTDIFYFGPVYWAIIPFAILSFLEGKNIKLSIIYWICSVILNLIFLKRFIIIDSLLMLIVLCIILFDKNKINKKLLLKILAFVAVSACIVIATLGHKILPLFDMVMNRFKESSDLETFDRFVEAQNYFKTTNIVDILLGKGFLNTQYGLGIQGYALHVGWSNFIFKGGIFLLIAVIIPYFKMLSLLSNLKRLPMKIKFSVYMMMVYAVRLIYVNMHSFVPEMLIFFYCLFNVMDYNKKELDV
jgi:hypothetical protein